jgi:hypothetical protein
MDNQLLFGLLGGGVGVAVLTWMLGGISAYVRRRLENEAISKRTLFALLEIRYILRIVTEDADESAKVFLRLIDKKAKQFFPEEAFAEGDRQILLSLSRQASDRAKQTMLKNTPDLYETYRICIVEIAVVSPILAFQLRGREAFQSLLQDVDETFSELNKFISPEADESVRKLAAFTHKATKNMLLGEIFSSLDRDILRVAYQAGFFTYCWMICAFVASRVMKSVGMSDRQSEILMDSLLQKIREEYEKQKTVQANNEQGGVASANTDNVDDRLPP